MTQTASAAPAEAPGPHPSYIQVAKPFIFEQKVQSSVIATGANPQREDNYRLQGVQWIDDVRRALQLPVRTFDTACVYYHKFRLAHSSSTYIPQDAAAAALFAACKIEDTLKKSREILAAAHNLKVSPTEALTPDDSYFEAGSKTVIGLERLMLESSGFDYRNRYPQKYIFKIGRKMEVDKEAIKIAYNMMLDLYRTFSPLKLTSSAMSISCLELAQRLSTSSNSSRTTQSTADITPTSPGTQVTPQTSLEKLSKFDTKTYKCSRAQVMEGMLDLLDLYTHYQKLTKIGPNYTIQQFIDVRIVLNQEAERDRRPRYTQWREPKANGFGRGLKTPKTPTTPVSPAFGTSAPTLSVNGATVRESMASPPSPRSTSGSGRPGRQQGTVRFVLDAVEAKREKKIVDEFFKDEWEEVEIEVEETIMVMPENPPKMPREEISQTDGASDRPPKDAPREPRRDALRDMPREPARDAVRDASRAGSDRSRDSRPPSVRGSPPRSSAREPPRSSARDDHPPRGPARDRERERDRDAYSGRHSTHSPSHGHRHREDRERERERERDSYPPREPRDSRDARDRDRERNCERERQRDCSPPRDTPREPPRGPARDREPIRDRDRDNYPIRERERDRERDAYAPRARERDNYPSRDERDYKRVRR